MKILAKIHSNQRRLIEILRIIDEADKPIGARAISDALCIRGYDLGERAVRYNLKVLDELGFTEKQGYSGRALTYLGIKELNDALVNDRIGFVNTRIEEYIYRTTFDPRTAKGNVVANVSTVRKADYEKARDVMTEAFEAGCTVSKRVLVMDEGEGKERYEIPEGSLGIITVCSITLDGDSPKQGNSNQYQLRRRRGHEGEGAPGVHRSHSVLRLVHRSHEGLLLPQGHQDLQGPQGPAREDPGQCQRGTCER